MDKHLSSLGTINHTAHRVHREAFETPRVAPTVNSLQGRAYGGDHYRVASGCWKSNERAFYR
jgi:hypothetical protein